MEKSRNSKHTINSVCIGKLRLILFLFLSMVLTSTMVGCVSLNDPEVSQEYFSDTLGILNPHTTIGQSLIARRPLLSSLTFWISPLPNQTENHPTENGSSIYVELFNSIGDPTPLFTTTVFTSLTHDITPITVQISNLKTSPGENIYLQLSTNSGAIQINGRNEDSYTYGQAFINKLAVDADIAFRVSYDYDTAAFLNDFKLGMGKIWIIFPLSIVLWLPGWLLLEFSELRRNFDFAEQCALSFGISLAVIPVMMLWTTLLKIHWSKDGILLTSGALVILFFLRIIGKFRGTGKTRSVPDSAVYEEHPNLGMTDDKAHFIESFALITIFILALILRMIMVRDLATPAWVDSIHHALITRLILLNGGFPSSFFPYLNISPTAYHLGFHSISAVFIWLSNMSIDQALLSLGQVLNALAIFPVYLLTKNLTSSSVAGLIAATITGFLTPMPAYYVSWGRYTELTALIILPTAFIFIRLLGIQKSAKQRNWIILLGSITSAGLFMVHYRVVVFLFCLVITYLLIYEIFARYNLSIHLWNKFKLILLTSIISIGLVSPWLVQTFKNTVWPILEKPVVSVVPYFQDFSWAYLTSALGRQSLVIAGLGLLWGIINKKRFTYLLVVWTFILFLIANLGPMKLPGGGLITSSSVEIMLFIPISILGGYFTQQIVLMWKKLTPKKYIFLENVASVLLLGVIIFVGARQLATIVNPITILSRYADLPAIEWIDDNLPENEIIVINPFSWGYGVYAGNDGGYWISPLSGRVTLTPPVLYGIGADISNINEASQKIIEFSTNPGSLTDYLRANQLKYVYIGAKGGVLSPEKLSTSGLFTTLYHQDGVWLLKVKP